MRAEQGNQAAASGLTALEWAARVCDSTMAGFKPNELPPANRWHYHQGVFLQAMEGLWRITGEQKYLQYIREYVDLFVDGDGNLAVQDHLDDLMPGQLLLTLHQETGADSYKAAADMLIGKLEHWKRNAAGGFWHKDIYPDQMWLDGIYMQGPFAVKYAELYSRKSLVDLVVEQALLMFDTMWDEETGLLYHAWDASRKAAWAHPETGLSPEFWGRSVGWYGFALVDMLDSIRPGHTERSKLISILVKVVEGVIQYQDRENGLWYQVTNKPEQPGNWPELSCSTLFVYTIAKAVRMGYVPAALMTYARSGFEGVCRRVGLSEDGAVFIPDICIGTGVGDYQHYIKRERKTNDLHGAATFVHMCLEMAGQAVE